MRIQHKLIAILLAAPAFATCLAHAGGGTYTVTDLGTLGGTTSRAQGINNAGVVVGSSPLSAGSTVPRAFRWANGTMIDLGTLGGPSSEAFDINDAGQITGTAETIDSLRFTPIMHTFRWENGMMTDLGTTGGDSSRGAAINAAGQIAGTSQVCMIIDPEGGRPGPCFPVGNEYTFFYDGKKMTDLGGLFGSSDSSAFGMNSAGLIVGQSIAVSGFSQPRHAVLWQGGVAIDLGTLGGLNGWATDINDAGAITGFADVAPPGLAHHVFLRAAGGGPLMDLGALPGSNQAESYAINNAGRIVGTSAVFDEWHAFIYDGTMHDLNDLIPAGSGWVLNGAWDINEAGKIIGTGLHNGVERGFLLTPVTPADCGADINCNGHVDGLDIGIMLSNWSIPPTAPGCGGALPCLSDLNGDGRVDGLDIGILLAAWTG